MSLLQQKQAERRQQGEAAVASAGGAADAAAGRAADEAPSSASPATPAPLERSASASPRAPPELCKAKAVPAEPCQDNGESDFDKEIEEALGQELMLGKQADEEDDEEEEQEGRRSNDDEEQQQEDEGEGENEDNAAQSGRWRLLDEGDGDDDDNSGSDNDVAGTDDAAPKRRRVELLQRAQASAKTVLTALVCVFCSTKSVDCLVEAFYNHCWCPTIGGPPPSKIDPSLVICFSPSLSIVVFIFCHLHIFQHLGRCPHPRRRHQHHRHHCYPCIFRITPTIVSIIIVNIRIIWDPMIILIITLTSII